MHICVMSRGKQNFEMRSCSSQSETKQNILEIIKSVSDLHRCGKVHGNLSPLCFKRAAGESGPLQIVSPLKNLLTQIVVPNRYFFLPQIMFSRKEEESSLLYRPPEVLVQGVADLLKCGTDARSLAAIDMWSVGCLFAEMMIGSPLFESAETSFDLLSLHCDWLGYKFTSPDGYLEVRSPDSAEGKPKLTELVPGLCIHGYDLLSRLLACDYQQRISAEEAERHAFFSCACDLTYFKCFSRCRNLPQNCAAECASSVSIHHEERASEQTSLNFESYPSFMHSGSSDGLQVLPTFIQDLVVKRRLKRQRTVDVDSALVYRDAAPAV